MPTHVPAPDGRQTGPLAARIVRHTLLTPRPGLKTIPDGPAREAARLALVAAWPARVDALQEAGLSCLAGPEAGTRKRAMRDCPPDPSLLAGATGRPCGWAAFCPHCWARRALEAWRIVDPVMFPHDGATRQARPTDRDEAGPGPRARGPSRRADYALVARTFEHRLPLQLRDDSTTHPVARWIAFYFDPDDPGDADRTGYAAEPRCEASRRALAAAGSVGSLEVAAVDVHYVEGRPRAYRVQVRQLHLARREHYGTLMDAAAEVAPPGRKPVAVEVAGVEAPTRLALADQIARIWAYPRSALRGDPALTAGWIAAQGDRHLSVWTGVLGGPVTDPAPARSSAHPAPAPTGALAEPAATIETVPRSKSTCPPLPAPTAIDLLDRLSPPPGVADDDHRAAVLLHYLDDRLRLGHDRSLASFLVRMPPPHPATDAFAAVLARHGVILDVEDRLLLLASYADALARDPEADLADHCRTLLGPVLDAPASAGGP